MGKSGRSASLARRRSNYSVLKFCVSIRVTMIVACGQSTIGLSGLRVEIPRAGFFNPAPHCPTSLLCIANWNIMLISILEFIPIIRFNNRSLPRAHLVYCYPDACRACPAFAYPWMFYMRGYDMRLHTMYNTKLYFNTLTWRMSRHAMESWYPILVIYKQKCSSLIIY